MFEKIYSWVLWVLMIASVIFILINKFIFQLPVCFYLTCFLIFALTSFLILNDMIKHIDKKNKTVALVVAIVIFAILLIITLLTVIIK